MNTSRIKIVSITAVLTAFVLVGCDAQTVTPTSITYDSAATRYTSPDPDGDHSNADQLTIPSTDAPETTLSDTEQRNLPGPLSAASARELRTSQPRREDVSDAPTVEPSLPNGLTDDDRIAALEQLVQQLREELDEIRRTNVDETNDGGETLPHSIGQETLRSDIEPGINHHPGNATPSSPLYTSNYYGHTNLAQLIRRYRKAKRELERSEMSYKIDHGMTLLKGMELLFHSTPQTFNPLPERDKYAFRDFQEAAEELIPELEAYLAELATNEERSELDPLLTEARRVAEMEPPGTGNRLLDFLQQLKEMDEEHQDRQE